MRHFLFLLAACGLTLPALAQTERGAKLVGVSVGNLSYTRYENDRSEFSVNATPAAGWFVANRLAVGGALQLGYLRGRYHPMSVQQPTEINFREVSYGLSPFVRYYVLGSGKHRLYGQVEGGKVWFRNRVRTEEGPNSYTTKGRASTGVLFGGVGYNYFVTPSVALEAQAGYRRDFRPLQELRTGALDVRLGFSIFLPGGGSAAAD